MPEVAPAPVQEVCGTQNIILCKTDDGSLVHLSKVILGLNVGKYTSQTHFTPEYHREKMFLGHLSIPITDDAKRKHIFVILEDM